MKSVKYLKAKEFNNIKEIICNSAKEYSDKTAFVIKNKKDKEVNYKKISYNKLLKDVNSLGTEFFSLGFKGKRVAIIGKNRYEWIQTHLTNLLGGIVSIPLDKDLQLEELINSLERSKADVIVFDSKLTELIEQIKNKDLSNLKEYICMDEIEGYKSIPELTNKGMEKLESGNSEYVDYKIDENAMNILLFTSGTTSQAKAVMLSMCRRYKINRYKYCIFTISPYFWFYLYGFNVSKWCKKYFSRWTKIYKTKLKRI